MHGNDWTGQDVSGWIVSEKLNGHRVRWTGKKLLSRSGIEINAPKWFTANLPDFALDCELWAGRGKDHNDVKKLMAKGDFTALQLVAFDVPGMNESKARLVLNSLVCAVRFSVIDSIDAAKQLMLRIVSEGGEGIMLRKPGSEYLPCRNDNLLKMKP